MTDVTPPPKMSTAQHVSPSMLGPKPGRGFIDSFLWGLRQTLLGRRFLIAAGIAASGGYLLASEGVGTLHRGWKSAPDSVYDMWNLLDNPILPYVLPIVAMFVVAGGFSKEVGQRTLVYHLVRPISRSTLFVSRYLSGVIPAIVISIVLLIVFSARSGVSVPNSYWWSLPLTATFGTIAIGAVYYTLAALFRSGTILGLVYTFAFDPLFAQSKGSMQKLSVMYHVRSLHHQLTDAFFIDNSARVKREMTQSIEDIAKKAALAAEPGELLKLSESIAWSSEASAMLTLTLIAVVSLLIGCFRISRRDFPLKD